MVCLIILALVLAILILVYLTLPVSEWRALLRRLGRASRTLLAELRQRWRARREGRQRARDAAERDEDEGEDEQADTSWQIRHARPILQRLAAGPPETIPPESMPHRQPVPIVRRPLLIVVLALLLLAVLTSLWQVGTRLLVPPVPPRLTIVIAGLGPGRADTSPELAAQHSSELAAFLQQQLAEAGLPPTMTVQVAPDIPADAAAALSLARARQADLLLWGRVRGDLDPCYVVTLTVVPTHVPALAPEFVEYTQVMLTPPHFPLNNYEEQGLDRQEIAGALVWAAHFYSGQFELVEGFPAMPAGNTNLSPDLVTFHWISLRWLKGEYEAAKTIHSSLGCPERVTTEAALTPRQEAQRALCLAANQNKAVILITQESLGKAGASVLDEAIALLQGVVQAQPEAVVARYNLGRAYLARNRWTEAAAALEEVVQRQPGNAAAQAALSEADAELWKIGAAKDAADRAVAADPNLPAGHAAQGRCLLALDQINEAERAAQEALQLAESESSRRRSLETAEREGPRATPRRADYTAAWARRNDAALAHAHLTLARVYLRQGEMEGQPSFLVWLWRVIVSERSPIEKAAAELERAKSLHPNWSVALRLQARLAIASGKLDEAVEQLRQLQEADTADLQNYIELIDVLRRQWDDLRRQGRNEEAQKKLGEIQAEYRLLIERGVAPARGYFGLGDLAQTIEDWNGARQEYTSAVEFDPRYAEAYLRLGYVERHESNEELALDYLAMAIDAAEDRGTVATAAHVARGEIYLEQYLRGRVRPPRQPGRLEDARREFQAALQQDGGAVGALSGLGRIAYEEGKLQEAEGLFQRALSVDGRYFSALYGLGRVYQGTGQSGLAAEHLRRALQSNGGSIAAHYHLGAAYYALLQEDQARSNLEWVQQACPSLDQQKLPLADDIESCDHVEDWLKRLGGTAP